MADFRNNGLVEKILLKKFLLENNSKNSPQKAFFLLSHVKTISHISANAPFSNQSLSKTNATKEPEVL